MRKSNFQVVSITAFLLTSSLTTNNADAGLMDWFSANDDVRNCHRWLQDQARVMNDEDLQVELTKHHAGDEVDTAHDLEENDPSVAATELRTKKFFKQDYLVVKGINSHIDDNIEESFEKIIDDVPENVDEILSTEASQSMLKIHADRYQPKAENGLTSVNSNTEFCGISDRSHGVCYGYATLQRNFHMLADFNPDLPKLSTQAAYLKKIDAIVAGKATSIPGYKNLREFSLVPEFELYQKLNTMGLWESRAVRRKSLRILRNATDPMTPKEQAAIVSDLERRLARGEMPKIIFSALVPSGTILGMNTDIHVVLVNGIQKLENGNTRIQLWDINFYAETLQKEPKFLEIDTKNKIHYAPWYEPKAKYAKKSDLVANIQITPENDAELYGMVQSLRAYCKHNPERCRK